MEAPVRIELTIEELQSSALPLGYGAILERKTGFEPATPTLARSYSTTELLPHEKLGWKGSNLRVSESKSDALPLGYSPIKGRLMGIEPTNAGITIRCVNHFATIARLK